MTSTCDYCSSSDFTSIISECPDYVTGDKFEVFSCVNCRLSKTSPLPECFDKYYHQKYRAYSKLVSGVLRFFYRLKVAHWSAKFDKPGTILEVGCGAGYMLNEFKKLGWKVYGTERSPEAAKDASKLVGDVIFTECVKELPQELKFDLVLLFQALEHMSNPHQLLIDSAERLNPGGRLIIGVPNFGSWQRRLFGAKWFHLDVPRHTHHFTAPVLRTQLASLNMSVEEISYVSWEHDLFGWLQSALNLVDRKFNSLTMLLMGMRRMSLKDILITAPMAAFCVPTSMIIMLVSWITGNGAIMNLISIKEE